MEKILVYTTWGPTDPTRAGLAFAYAVTAKKQGQDVELFLFHDGVLLAQKGTYEKVIPIGPPPLKEVVEFLVQQGVKIHVCKACYETRGLVPENLISTAELKGIDHFATLVQERKVISF
jgi:uncharacterized protein